MAYRYTVPVNILNKELWAANKQYPYILAVRQAAILATKHIKHYEVQQTDRQTDRDLDHLNVYSKL